MQDSHGGNELVAIQATRKDFGDPRPEHLFALGAIFLAQPMEGTSNSQGSRLQYVLLLTPLVLQRTPTMRTRSPVLGVHLDHLVGF
jgi:hypothetical protein